MTTWINKDKFKKENFSIKEGFDNKPSDKNPLEQFLKANPLKSIFDREVVDSRNLQETITPNDELNSIENFNNIKPIGSPDYKNLKRQYSTIKNKAKRKLTHADIKRDDALIESIIVSLFSLFITLYVSYNWYFNFTEGFSKRIKFHERFDFVNYLYFFSEYFYKIIKLFDTVISIEMPKIVEKMKGSFFKERSIFILILIISHYAVQSIIALGMSVYKYVKTFVETGQLNVLKLLFDPLNNTLYITLLFVYYVIEGMILSFTSGLSDKNKEMNQMNGGNVDASNLGSDLGETDLGEAVPDLGNLDPGDSFKASMTEFKIAHPLSYLIIMLIRVSTIYGPTIAFSSMFFLLYFKFYSLFGITYYLKFNKDPITPKSNLYSGVREGSFLDMFRRIHAIMNANHVFTEIKDEPEEFFEKVLSWVEWGFRLFFNNLPFLVIFSWLFGTIPSVLKIYSPMYKWTGIGLISFFTLALIKFMLEENPKIYVLQQIIINEMNSTIKSFSKIFEKKEDVAPTSNAPTSNAPTSNAPTSNAPTSNAP
jgi:hypothetical protein